MSSQRYSELRECEEARRELRELSAELSEALDGILKDRSLYELSFTNIDRAQRAAAKAQKLK